MSGVWVMLFLYFHVGYEIFNVWGDLKLLLDFFVKWKLFHWSASFENHEFYSTYLLFILTLLLPNISHTALRKTLQIFVVIPVYIAYPINLIMYQLVCIPVICIVVFCMMFNAKNSKRMGYDHMRLVLHMFSHTSVAAF